MKLLVKFQMPTGGAVTNCVLCNDRIKSFITLLPIETERELVGKIFTNNKQVAYWECEVVGNTIKTLVKEVSAYEADF